MLRLVPVVCTRRRGPCMVRLRDFVLALPCLGRAVAFVAILGRGMFVAVFAIAFVSLQCYVRLTRAAVMGDLNGYYVTAARLAAEEGVKIYPIGIGADPEQTGSLGILGLTPSLDLDEPALKAIADATGGRYFRASDGNELQAIKETLDQLEPVAQQPTQARPAQALYSAPLALALLLSMLLVIQERWPDNALQRLFNKLSSKSHFLQANPEWRERLKRLRLRRRR